MLCFRCDKPARGSCRFCGRALCEGHQARMPFILSIYLGREQVAKAVVVADALFCGTCKPQPEPIDMPELS